MMIAILLLAFGLNVLSPSGYMIAVGKGLKPAWPKPGQLPLEEVLIHDRFA